MIKKTAIILLLVLAAHMEGGHRGRPYRPAGAGLCPDPVPGMPGGGQHGL